MTVWKAKRFWKEATAVPEAGGFGIRLDGRPVKTPAKASLVVPTLALAREIAAEWAAQEETVDPAAMPFTRTANAAIDKVAPQRREVVEMLAAYGDSDLLCYRAEAPVELARRQAEAWDPLLEWAAAELGARLEVRTGVIHRPQPPEALERLSKLVDSMGNFELAAFHDLVALSGSLVIGFAVIRGQADDETLWRASRLDETWQEEQWGRDEEAQEAAQRRRAEFMHAARFYRGCIPDDRSQGGTGGEKP